MHAGSKGVWLIVSYNIQLLQAGKSLKLCWTQCDTALDEALTGIFLG